ncbi:MAG: HAD family hydrolase [Planctomycetaceae bacterium]
MAEFAVIFDVDGVLIDSYQAHFESWKRLFREQGRDYSLPEFVWGFGRTSREVLARQWPAPASDKEIDEIAARKEAYYREIVAADFPAIDGARELICALADAGVPIAVGSSGPPPNVQLVIEKLGVQPLIQTVITGADVERGKPDPQVFQLAGAGLKMKPERCIVIEDAPVGIEAARAAGMKCVGLASTGRTVEELQAANLIVRTLRDVTPERLGAIADGKEQH